MYIKQENYGIRLIHRTMQLLNKVALITGAASDRSIGWGIAETLAKEGADVILNDLPSRRDELSARIDTLQGMGRRAVMAPADITTAAGVQEMMNTGIKALGRLDIACSNAGIIRWQPFLEITPDVLQKQVDINVKGNLLVCKAAAEQMIQQGGGGRIIVTSSVQTYVHFPINPVYGATKHAMHIFIGGLALELAPHNITVNHIGPGWVQTAMNDTSPELQSASDIENQRNSIPIRRAGTIEEMGSAVAYFASEQAAYTTGEFLAIDGGLGIGKYSF